MVSLPKIEVPRNGATIKPTAVNNTPQPTSVNSTNKSSLVPDLSGFGKNGQSNAGVPKITNNPTSGCSSCNKSRA